MKKFLVFFGIAVSIASSAFAADRFSRIMSDPVLDAVIRAMEDKHEVTCNRPETSEDIQWRCLNGPQCGYTFQVYCPHFVNGQKLGGWTLRVEGFDNGKSNDIYSIKMAGIR